MHTYKHIQIIHVHTYNTHTPINTNKTEKHRHCNIWL